MNEIIHILLIYDLSKNWEKYVFRWEKLNFEHIGNSVHTTEFLGLEKAVNIYINYLMFYPTRQHVKLKHFSYTSLHENDFMLKILSLPAESWNQLTY